MARIKKIDHIGIVVFNLKESIRVHKDLLFQEPTHYEVFDATKVELAFFDIAGVQIELLSPTAPDSDIMPFLKEKGGGIHHICYEVEGIHDILNDLKKKGFKLIDETPRPGSRNSQIAFVDATSTKGVYIEYCEFSNDRWEKGE
jgi:methylmalonyl-CoA/ethylmalonyl-CoA epimerase